MVESEEEHCLLTVLRAALELAKESTRDSSVSAARSLGLSMAERKPGRRMDHLRVRDASAELSHTGDVSSST